SATTARATPGTAAGAQTAAATEFVAARFVTARFVTALGAGPDHAGTARSEPAGLAADDAGLTARAAAAEPTELAGAAADQLSPVRRAVTAGA
ncbi:MAG: hypothetical protein JWN99_1081, partial [Ilumatobacteraceae bacterium]|nr:hypothetical protein [Ilumatobacteraceae bacterium]